MTANAKKLITKSDRMDYLTGPVICSVCDNVHNAQTDFRDNLSYREWEISGLCQECQDAVFGRDSEPIKR